MSESQHLGWIEKEARRDYIKGSQRAGEMTALIGILLATLFFYAHQAWSTGFFTSSFGTIEASLFYGAILLGLTGPAVRTATGSRNAARPAELVATVFWVVASIWLLALFPFNFDHFADVLPDYLKFFVSWVTDDIARGLIVVGTIGGIVFMGVNALLYSRIRNLLHPRQAP